MKATLVGDFFAIKSVPSLSKKIWNNMNVTHLVGSCQVKFCVFYAEKQGFCWFMQNIRVFDRLDGI